MKVFFPHSHIHSLQLKVPNEYDILNYKEFPLPLVDLYVPEEHKVRPAHSGAIEEESFRPARQLVIVDSDEVKRAEVQHRRALNAKEKAKAHEAFEKYDADNSGLIEADEMIEILKDLGIKKAKNPELIQQVLSAADIDGDGTVDFDEFEDFYKECLSSEDADAGRVSLFYWQPPREPAPPLLRTDRNRELPTFPEAPDRKLETDLDHLLQLTPAYPPSTAVDPNTSAVLADVPLFRQILDERTIVIEEVQKHGIITESWRPVRQPHVIAVTDPESPDVARPFLDHALAEDDLSDSDTDSEDEWGLPMVDGDVLLTKELAEDFFDEIDLEPIEELGSSKRDSKCLTQNIRSIGSVYGRREEFGIPKSATEDTPTESKDEDTPAEEETDAADGADETSAPVLLETATERRTRLQREDHERRMRLSRDSHRDLDFTLERGVHLTSVSRRWNTARAERLKLLPDSIDELTGTLDDPRLTFHF